MSMADIDPGLLFYEAGRVTLAAGSASWGRQVREKPGLRAMVLH
jgi:hypothetical protein